MHRIYVKKDHPVTSAILILFNKKFSIDILKNPNKFIDVKPETFKASFDSGIAPLIKGGFITMDPKEALMIATPADMAAIESLETTKVVAVAPEPEPVVVQEAPTVAAPEAPVAEVAEEPVTPPEMTEEANPAPEAAKRRGRRQAAQATSEEA